MRGMIFPSIAGLYLLAALPGAAQPPSDPFDRGGMDLAAALSRADLPSRAKVAVLPFRDNGVDVVCQPLSADLTNRIHTAVDHYRTFFGLDFVLLPTDSFGGPDAVLAGRWQRKGGGQISLMIKAADVGNADLPVLLVTEVALSEADLLPEMRDCILELSPVEREVVAHRPLTVRSGPSPDRQRIAEIPPGDTLWVAARTRVHGDEWLIVHLPDNENLPVGMRSQRGFVRAELLELRTAGTSVSLYVAADGDDALANATQAAGTVLTGRGFSLARDRQSAGVILNISGSVLNHSETVVAGMPLRAALVEVQLLATRRKDGQQVFMAKRESNGVAADAGQAIQQAFGRGAEAVVSDFLRHLEER